MSVSRKNNWSTSNEERINHQINLELYASHVYNSLYAYFRSNSVGFPGLAEYFKKAADEEKEHAQRFIEYQNIRGGLVKIGVIDCPSYDFSNTNKSLLLQAFEYALELEQQVYESIVKISREGNDVGLEDFLDDFVKEQLEAQYDLGLKIKQLQIIGNDGHGLIHFDKEMLS